MTNSTKLQEAGYKGIKVTSMLTALLTKEMFAHLRLVQQDELRGIQNRYNKNKFLTKPYFQYLWALYWNFVLNDFRFDSGMELTIPTKITKVTETHIGLKMYEELINQKN
jgi:hypothetical protein